MALNNILPQVYLYRFVFIFILILGAGLLTGAIFDMLFHKLIRRLSKNSRIMTDQIFIKSVSGIFKVVFLLAAAYIATVISPIPHNIIEYIKKGLGVLLILSITYVTSKFLNLFIIEVLIKRNVITTTSTILSTFIKLVVLVVGILISLQYLNISILPIITALGVGGLAVALALQETMSNFFSGIQIITSSQFKTGQYIKLDNGQEGYIIDINWRNTIIRTQSNNMVVIPNSKLSTGIITNFHIPDKELTVEIKAGVSYDSDLDKVEKVAIMTALEIMKNVRGGVPGFVPFIRYNELSDSSINFNVILRAGEYADQYLIKHEFIKLLLQNFKKEGIAIPYPTRTIHMDKTD